MFEPAADVTVTVTDPVDALKAFVPVKAAVMTLLPIARLLPVTVSVAIAEPPERVSGAEPRRVVPRVKDTVPAGAALPEAGLTVAISCVVAAGAMLARLAVTVVVVATPDDVTVTDAVPDEGAKFPAGT
jgi:hypothetical protein